MNWVGYSGQLRGLDGARVEEAEMANNWRCPECGAVNPENRDGCLVCDYQLNRGKGSSDLPTGVRQHLEQAYAYHENDEFEDALRECECVIQLAPNWAEAHNLRGIVLEEVGRKVEAVAAYREAVCLDPAFLEAKENLSEAEAELTEQGEALGEGIVSASQPAERDRSQLGGREVTLTTTMSNTAVAVTGTYEVMLKNIRSWGWWSLGLGAVHLFIAGFLSAPWGILLLLVGLASFYFREAAMFVIYGVTLAWAAISNLLGGQTGWSIFALFQLVLAFQVFRQFFRYRGAEAEYAVSSPEAAQDTPLIPQRAARAFPWLGCLLGTLSLVGLVAIVVGVIIFVEFAETPEFPVAWGWLEGLVLNGGILALAVGLASLLSGYRYKAVAVLGMVAGTLVLLIELTLALIG
jgi:tetratricopeptide (TPR) repeat protein